MKKFIGLLIFIGLLVFLYLSCPDKQAHDEAVIDSLPEIAADYGLENSILNNQGVQDAINQLSKQGISIVDVDSYLLFSIGKINDQVVSFGIGGYVFSYKDDIVKYTIEIVEDMK
jgi:hypothetical protein